MNAPSAEILRYLEAISYFFTALMVAVCGVTLLIYTISSTMAKLAKQRDDVEQLALKFSHRR